MPPLPPCDTLGLVNLCAPATMINWPSWFYLSVPNLIWYLAVIGIVLLGIFLPFPARRVDTKGYQSPEGE